MFKKLVALTFFLTITSSSHAVNTFSSYDLSVSKISEGTQNTPTGATYEASIIAPEPPPLKPQKVCSTGYSYESASDLCVTYIHLEANCPAGYTLSGDTCTKSEQIADSKNFSLFEETCWENHSYCESPNQIYYINGKLVSWTGGAHVILGRFGAYTRYEIGKIIDKGSDCPWDDYYDPCYDHIKYGYNVKHVQPALQNCPLGYHLHTTKCRKTKSPKIIYV